MNCTAQIKKFKEFLEKEHNIKPKKGFQKRGNRVTGVTRVTPFKFLDGKTWLPSVIKALGAKNPRVTGVTLPKDDLVTLVTPVTQVTRLPEFENKHKLALILWQNARPYSEILAILNMSKPMLKKLIYKNKGFLDIIPGEPKKYKASLAAKQEVEMIVTNLFADLNTKRKKLHEDLIKQEQKKEVEEFVPIYAELLEQIRKGKQWLDVDFRSLARFSPALAEDLLDNPEETLKALQISASETDEQLPENFEIRPYNLPEDRIIEIGDLRSEHIGKLWRFEVDIVLVGTVERRVSSARFECPSCGTIINVIQTTDFFNQPMRCGCGRKGKFRMLDQILYDAQILRLEEIAERIEDRTTRNIDILLKRDLTRRGNQKYYESSEAITFTAIPTEHPVLEKGGGLSTRKRTILEAVSVDHKFEIQRMEITEQDEKRIKKTLADPNVLHNYWLKAFAPEIYGCNIHKTGALLVMVSTTKMKAGLRVIPLYMLLYGDPGTVKSHIAKRAHQTYPGPKVLIETQKVSVAGLIGTSEQDPILGTWSTRKGDLYKCHGGLLIVDELAMQMDGVQKLLQNIMSAQRGQQVQNRKLDYDVVTAMILCSNTKNEKDLKEGSVRESLRSTFSHFLLDRIEVIVPMIYLFDKDTYRGAVESMICSYTGKDENTQSPEEESFLRKMIYYCIHKVKSNVSKTNIRAITKAITGLAERNQDKVKMRQGLGLAKLCFLFARLHGKSEPEEVHIKMAFEFYKDTWLAANEGENLEITEEDVKEESPPGPPKEEEVKLILPRDRGNTEDEYFYSKNPCQRSSILGRCGATPTRYNSVRKQSLCEKHWPTDD